MGETCTLDLQHQAHLQANQASSTYLRSLSRKNKLDHIAGIDQMTRRHHHAAVPPDVPDARLHTIEHVVLVAGPSGSGKSTFLQQLSAGELPVEIMAELPIGSERWPQYKVAKGQIDDIAAHLKANGLKSLILHYDLTGKVDQKWKFNINRKLGELLKLPRAVTVVNVTAPPERLVRQLAQNKLGIRGQNLKWALFTWRMTNKIDSAWARIARLFRHSSTAQWPRARPLSGSRSMPTKKLKKQFLKVSLYSRKGWLETLLDQWRESLELMAGPTTRIKHVYVEPGRRPSRGEGFEWRLRHPWGSGGSSKGDR
jgi:hypothetical protein